MTTLPYYSTNGVVCLTFLVYHGPKMKLGSCRKKKMYVSGPTLKKKLIVVYQFFLMYRINVNYILIAQGSVGGDDASWLLTCPMLGGDDTSWLLTIYTK